MTLGLCMIVKNEEETLGRCLESVAGIFDEIVIADTGSTDRTKSVAMRYTDKIYEFDVARRGRRFARYGQRKAARVKKPP